VCGVLEITTPVKGWHEQGTAGVPTGWKDDGETLTAPNGIAVVKGFREWVLTHGWNPEDEPQGPEVSVEHVQMADPAQGAGCIQMFLLTGQLCWTQAHGVYVAHPGAEIFALRAALEAARKSAPTVAEMAALAAIRSVGAALKAAETGAVT
jgi:hypothetical protein